MQLSPSVSSFGIHSGTHWSVLADVDLLLYASRLSLLAFNHGWNRMSSLVILSSGSRRSKARMMQRDFEDRHSGRTYMPRDILANNDACSESLKGYL